MASKGIRRIFSKIASGRFYFQDRRFQPLTHSSVFNSNVFCKLAASLLQRRFELLHFGAESAAEADARPTKVNQIQNNRNGGYLAGGKRRWFIFRGDDELDLGFPKTGGF
jgi:hypothetical protein